MKRLTVPMPCALLLLVASFQSREARCQEIETVISIENFFPFALVANDSIKRLYVTGAFHDGRTRLVVVDGNDYSQRFVELDPAFDVVGGLSVDRHLGDVYVVTERGPAVSVVDALKAEVETTTLVGFPFRAHPGVQGLKLVGVNAETRTLYVLSTQGRLGAFDVETQGLREVDFRDFFVLSLAVNSVTNKVFVAVTSLDARTGLVAVVDGADLTTTTISFGDQFFSNHAIAVNEETNQLYLGGFGRGGVGRAVAVVNGNDHSFRVIPIDDVQPFDIAVNPRTAQAFVVGQTLTREAQLWTIEHDGTATATTLGNFDPYSLAADRYTSRIYILGTNAQGIAQILVLKPTGCSSEIATVEALVPLVQSLATSPDTINVLLSNLDNVQQALDNANNGIARSRLSNFVDRIVNRSNYSATNPDRILLPQANHLLCGASNVLIGIPLP